MDGRRRRYVPLDVNVAFGRTGGKLLTKFGNEGLFTWMLLLAAAKKETPQGTFTYTSDPEAWTKLGGIPTAFTLDEFFVFTGQLKKTRRTRTGRVQHVSIRGWEQWNKAWETQVARERSASKRAQITRRIGEEHANDTSTEGEYEGEYEGELKPLPDKPAETKPRKRDEVWDTLVAVIGYTPRTRTERGAWNSARKQLREADATPQQVRDRAAMYVRRWPGMSLTPSALVKHWSSLEHEQSVALVPRQTLRYGRGLTTAEMLRQAKEAS